MTQLQKWQAVNQCETQTQLVDLIAKFSDKEGMIQGRERKFDASKMIIGLSFFMEDEAPAMFLQENLVLDNKQFI